MARGPRDERGAIIPMVALLMSVLMGAAAMGVDLGQLRVGRVDMQSLADVVSLDLARQIDGRQTQVIQADPLWAQAREQSVARNHTTYGAHFSIGPDGDCYLVGRVLLEHLDVDELDRIIGVLYELVEAWFQPVLRIAFNR